MFSHSVAVMILRLNQITESTERRGSWKFQLVIVQISSKRCELELGVSIYLKNRLSAC